LTTSLTAVRPTTLASSSGRGYVGYDNVSALDVVLKAFKSRELELGLEVRYDDGQQNGSIWTVSCSVVIRKLASKRSEFAGNAMSKKDAKKHAAAAQQAYESLGDGIDTKQYITTYTSQPHIAVQVQIFNMYFVADCMGLWYPQQHGTSRNYKPHAS